MDLAPLNTVIPICVAVCTIFSLLMGRELLLLPLLPFALAETASSGCGGRGSIMVGVSEKETLRLGPPPPPPPEELEGLMDEVCCFNTCSGEGVRLRNKKSIAFSTLFPAASKAFLALSAEKPISIIRAIAPSCDDDEEEVLVVVGEELMVAIDDCLANVGDTVVLLVATSIVVPDIAGVASNPRGLPSSTAVVVVVVCCFEDEFDRNPISNGSSEAELEEVMDDEGNLPDDEEESKRKSRSHALFPFAAPPPVKPISPPSSCGPR